MQLTALNSVRCPLFLALLVFCVPSVVGQGGVCPISKLPLDETKWAEQAKCLLRTVKMQRVLGPKLASLPSPLDRLVGTANVIDKAILKRYIGKPANELPLGGPIDNPITGAQYFVIHDTSSPNLIRREIPPNDVINGIDWNAGKLEAHRHGERTHVWVDRVGESLTSRDYSMITLKSAVKLEDRYPQLKGLLVHTELIQPRRCNPKVKVCCRKDAKGRDICNDNIAPLPGFSEAQLDRLALLYVVASTRAGRWLIPAFHGVVDDEFGDRAHDDPQNFDLDVWANRLQALLTKLGAIEITSGAHLTDDPFQPTPGAKPVGPPKPFRTRPTSSSHKTRGSSTTGGLKGTTQVYDDGTIVTDATEEMHAKRAEGLDASRVGRWKQVQKGNTLATRQGNYSYQNRELPDGALFLNVSGIPASPLEGFTATEVRRGVATKFGKGDRLDEGTGSPHMGTIQTNSDIVGGSVKISLMAKIFGNDWKHNEKRFRSLIEVYFEGRMVRVPLVDVGPAEDLESGAEVDLTTACDQFLGTKGLAKVEYRVLVPTI